MRHRNTAARTATQQSRLARSDVPMDVPRGTCTPGGRPDPLGLTPSVLEPIAPSLDRDRGRATQTRTPPGARGQRPWPCTMRHKAKATTHIAQAPHARSGTLYPNTLAACSCTRRLGGVTRNPPVARGQRPWPCTMRHKAKATTHIAQAPHARSGTLYPNTLAACSCTRRLGGVTHNTPKRHTLS
jgi:hypothetical protein